LILVNLLRLAALVALANGSRKLAAAVITVPLGIEALVIGVYSHLLSPGTDNLLRMPPGEVRLQFQISVLLLVVLAVLGCGIGLRMFARNLRLRI
jgi:cobalamin synthase